MRRKTWWLVLLMALLMPTVSVATDIGCCVCIGRCNPDSAEASSLVCVDGTQTPDACFEACARLGGDQCKPDSYMRWRSCGSGCGSKQPMLGEVVR